MPRKPTLMNIEDLIRLCLKKIKETEAKDEIKYYQCKIHELVKVWGKQERPLRFQSLFSGSCSRIYVIFLSPMKLC